MFRSSVRTLLARVQSCAFLTLAIAGLSFTTSAAAQQAPKISGSPPTSVAIGGTYSFQPTVVDPDTPASNLRFSITNKPYWLSFSGTTGKLQGKAPLAGRWGNIRIAVTDGRSYVTMPAFAITAGTSSQPSGGTGNKAPTISGTPAKTARPGTAYSFTPSASDADGDKLTFSIQNRPAWATFSTTTGKLSGTPSASQVGTYSNITIKVTDGKATATLPAFAIAVSEVANGSATLSWAAPTQNTDGSTLTNLSGYRIVYGTSSSKLDKSISITNPGITRYVIENLSPATYYFAVKAVTSAGTESALSNVSSKTIK